MTTAFDFTAIDAWLDTSYPQLEADLCNLISIPSVGSAAEPSAPYGQKVAQCLELALSICKRLGFATDNVDGYCGIADIKGQSPVQVGVLGHLDVVPAVAAEWKYPPFDPVVADGCIFGRGAMDDKGPTLSALYAGAALLALGVPMQKTIRFVMGCNEEGGMHCVEYYLKKYDPPLCGFTPDGHFPAIIGEKGIYHYQLSRIWQAKENAALPRLERITAGIAENVIPGRAEAVFTNAAALLPILEGKPGTDLSREGDTLIVSTQGAAAHASTPEEGKNALAALLKILAPLTFAPAAAKTFVEELAKLCEDDSYGAGFGLAAQDELSRVTHVPTMLHLDGNGASLTCDMRYLLSQRREDCLARLSGFAAEYGFTFRELGYHDPLYLGKNHPLTGLLLESYREITGDMRPPLVIGGGTYAKTMKNFMGFGAEPAGAPEMAHQSNEHIACDHLLRCAKIYTRAIYRMSWM